MKRNGIKRRLAVLVVVAGLATTAWAQDVEVTPQVQQLYSEAHAAQASGDMGMAIQKYRAMLRLAPHLAPAYNNLGMVYFNTGNYPEAVAALSRGLALNPKMPGAQAMLGMSYLAIGKVAEAEGPLEAAVRAGADDQVQMSLAHDLLALKQYRKAASLLQDYTALHPKDQQAWYMLGNAYLELSEAALGQVNEINPNSVYAHLIAGEVDASMQNYQGALVEYAKALDEAPQQPGIHMHMADAYWALAEWDLAGKQYRSELENAPHNCQASWKLGNSILRADGSPGDALASLNVSIAECSELVQARVDRARALVKLDRASEAMPDLEIAQKQAPDEPSVHFLLAQVYRAEGKREEATQQMQRYAQLQQQESAAQAKQAKLVDDLQRASP